jgi:broad specificity polyphosphatase/5'/3'-nucleotidase SurE
MRILIANDDGIYSPGLRALADVARRFGDVRIVAPDVEQSSMGHAITHSRPLTVRATVIGDHEAFRVNGTPADCVTIGVAEWEGVDVVLSGINLGSNLGNSIWHSGTLAAAKQAPLLGLRGIALSTPTTEDQPDFRAHAVGRTGARAAAHPGRLPAGERQFSGEAARPALDPPISAPLRRQGGAGPGSAGPAALLDHHDAAGGA